MSDCFKTRAPNNVATPPATEDTNAPGFFKNFQICGGEDGTPVTADFLNAIIINLTNVVTASGVDDSDCETVLRRAIQAMSALQIETNNSLSGDGTASSPLGIAGFAGADPGQQLAINAAGDGVEWVDPTSDAFDLQAEVNGAGTSLDLSWMVDGDIVQFSGYKNGTASSSNAPRLMIASSGGGSRILNNATINGGPSMMIGTVARVNGKTVVRYSESEGASSPTSPYDEIGQQRNVWFDGPPASLSVTNVTSQFQVYVAVSARGQSAFLADDT